MIIVFVYFIYVLAWVSLVGGTVWLTLKFSKSKLLATILGLMVFLAMYWPAFGDLIPTLRLHNQLCEEEAGFTVFVTPEQWIAENPGTLETLIPYEKYVSKGAITLGNRRLGTKYNVTNLRGTAVKKMFGLIVDIETQITLATYTDFMRGYGNVYLNGDVKALKMWLNSSSCYALEEEKLNNVRKKEFLKKLKMES